MAWKALANDINHIDRSDETNGIGDADRFKNSELNSISKLVKLN